MKKILLVLAVFGLFMPVATAKESSGPTLTVFLEHVVREDSVAKGATRVPFMRLSLAASCDANITVHTIEVVHKGLGASVDLNNVYFVQGFRRISRAAHFDGSSGRAIIRLLNLTVPRCGAVQIQLLADIDPEASPAGEHAIGIETATAIRTSAEHVILSASSAALRVSTAPQKSAALEVRLLPAQKRLRYGTRARVVRLQLASDSHAAQKIRSITLTNHGTARDLDLQRMYLENSKGDILTRVRAKMDERRIELMFDPPFILPRNSTTVLTLRGEVRGSQLKTFELMIDEAGDVVAEPMKRL